MKKRIISFVTVLSILTSLCLASATAPPIIMPRWTFISEISTRLDTRDGPLYWSAVAVCYPLSQLTHTGVDIYLQKSNGYGWTTIDSEIVKTSGAMAGAGKEYYDWESGESYRTKVEVWAYQNNVKLEYAGPYYQYCNT